VKWRRERFRLDPLTQEIGQARPGGAQVFESLAKTASATTKNLLRFSRQIVSLLDTPGLPHQFLLLSQ
jgi:hypothetical protein